MIPGSLIAAAMRFYTCLRDEIEHCQPLDCRVYACATV